MSLGIRMSVILLKFKLSYDQFKIFIYLVNSMICVRSSCAKVQRLLEEDFNSIENLFDVHYKKSNKVTSIIRTVFAEYFGEVTIFQDNNSSKKKSYQFSSFELLGHKIIELVDEGMKRCFQFAKIREIFELLKHLQQKITGYEEYIKSLERILGLKNDGCEASEDEEEMQLKQIFMKIDRKIQERAQIAALYNDTSELQDREATVCNTSSLYEKEVICSIKDDINHLKEKEAEILYSATTSKSKTLEQQLSAHKNKEFTKRFLKSEFTRDLYQSDGESVLENVQNELTSDQTHPGFYCPEQKKAQRKKAQNLKDHALKESMRQLNPEETHNDSEFAEDLSKHVKPMPSALVNESIEGLVKREQKQDEKKLNILRKSIRGDQNTTHNEGAYQQKIKKVKLQNKLKPTYPFTKRKKLPTEPIHRANPGQRKIEPKAMDKMKKYFKN